VPETSLKLVPRHEDVTWVPYVVISAAGLFVAAIVLGIPAERIRGPLPPDPADTHAHDAHDDHAHGGHGRH
jgi:hypothetical protein